MDKEQIQNLLTPKFPKKHFGAALDHFSGIVSKFQSGDWEPCVAKAGKFIEAVLKALWVHAGQTPAAGRQFKADAIITGLGNLPTGTLDDTVRLTIPRASRFVYDIASNRGARHDPDEVDPNEMDASAVVPVCAWILAEMIRYSQKGVVDTTQAQEIVESLSARRYPLIEEVDGRVYFHHAKKSAPDVALMALARRYPKRIHKDELTATVRRHRFTANNANVALQRIKKFVDDDGAGNLCILGACPRMSFTGGCRLRDGKEGKQAIMFHAQGVQSLPSRPRPAAATELARLAS